MVKNNVIMHNLQSGKQMILQKTLIVICVFPQK